MRSILTVKVKTDGRQASWKEIENRNAAIAELADQNLGKFLWAGSGKGLVDFAFEVHDEQGAQAQIARTMLKHLPGWKYEIQAELAQRANMLRMHTVGERRRSDQRINDGRGIGLGL